MQQLLAGNVLGGHDGDTGAADVLDDDLADGDRCGNVNGLQLLDAVKDLALGNVAGGLDGNHAQSAAHHTDGAGDDTGGVGQFLLGVLFAILTGVAGDRDDFLAVHFHFKRAALTPPKLL